MENKGSYISLFLIIIAIIFVIFNSQISSFFDKKKTPDNISNDPPIIPISTKKNFYTPNKINGVFITNINYPIALSGKTKEEIYAIRKRYVANSIFSHNHNYEPSDAVYGQIESGKPWISANVCKDNDTNAMRTYGPSEESRFIANPGVLVALEYPFSYSDYPSEEWCANNIVNMIPDGFMYDGDKKEISVYYKKLLFPTDDSFSFYQFNGLNARDLGYKYAYVDPNKSTYKMNFLNDDNITNRTIHFENFLHLGGSCGVEGGCNNGSPRQSYLEFKQPKTDYSNTNGEIYIKLWHEQPNSVEDTPDIVEKIIIREY